jgi:hypothetical protein
MMQTSRGTANGARGHALPYSIHIHSHACLANPTRSPASWRRGIRQKPSGLGNVPVRSVIRIENKGIGQKEKSFLCRRRNWREPEGIANYGEAVSSGASRASGQIKEKKLVLLFANDVSDY